MALPASRDSSHAVATSADTELESLVGYNLKRAYVVVEKDFRAALGAGGLAPRSFSALSLVVNQPEISQSDVARHLGIERSGLVSIIDDLETRGYLTRKVACDRRVQALEPTAEGPTAYRTALDAVHAHEARLLAGLTQKQASELMEMLRIIRQSDRES